MTWVFIVLQRCDRVNIIIAFLRESAREAYLKIHYDYDGIKRVFPLSVELSELASFSGLKSAICSEIKLAGDMSAPVFAYRDEEGEYVDIIEKLISRFKLLMLCMHQN